MAEFTKTLIIFLNSPGAHDFLRVVILPRLIFTHMLDLVWYINETTSSCHTSGEGRSNSQPHVENC